MEDAKAALKILFKHNAEDRRRQCAKESEYNELLEKYELLQAQFDEHRVKEKDRRRMSKQFAWNNTNSVTQLQNEETVKLKEELELYKEKCQHLETNGFK